MKITTLIGMLLMTQLGFGQHNDTEKLKQEANRISVLNDSLQRIKTIEEAIFKAQKTKLESILFNDLEVANYNLEEHNYYSIVLRDSLLNYGVDSAKVGLKPENTSDYYALLALFKKNKSLGIIHSTRTLLTSGFSTKTLEEQNLELQNLIVYETNYHSVLTKHISDTRSKINSLKSLHETATQRLTDYSQLLIQFQQYLKKLLAIDTKNTVTKKSTKNNSDVQPVIMSYKQDEGIVEVADSHVIKESKIEDPNKIFEVVEADAEFPGGQTAMAKFLQMNLNYPQFALDQSIGGRVYLRFVISNEGEVSNIKVTRGIPLCEECGTEAIRVISEMPNWTPGKSNGKAVNMWYNLPIKFTP